MAKKEDGGNGKVNKSDAVREFLAQSPKATSQEVVTALAEKGIRVAPSLIYFVRSKQKQAKRQARRERVAESSRQSGAANPVEVVLRVKDLAREVGGFKNLKQLVDLLAE